MEQPGQKEQFMKVSVIGVGKLGYPVATAMVHRGHEVVGYDIDKQNLTYESRPYTETGPDGKVDFNEWFQVNRNSLKDRLVFTESMEEVVDFAKIVFIAVQTPHHPEYEGVTRLPKARSDFDYTYLVEAVRQLNKVITKETTVVIVSTVLPGTMRQYVLPLCSDRMRIVYSPQFIAMGTTMSDFLNPEFWLVGGDDKRSVDRVSEFYKSISNKTVCRMSVESAELTKVAYNVFIGQKINFVNTLMEVCHKIPGCDVDSVTDTLKMATSRLISSKYLTAGGQDGGGCHPRDQIALSFLAKKLELSCDLFEHIISVREKQTEWFASLIEFYHRRNGCIPIVLLGYSYKPETNLTVGSYVLLLKSILKEHGVEVEMYDPYIDKGYELKMDKSVVVFVGTKHQEFIGYDFPEGSVVLDPWRYIPDQEGVEVIGIGKC